MGVELLKIGIKMRKGVMLTIRGCFKSVRSHPFLVFLLSLLIYMYRSSPFMFSLLVYASPILVCTAVLLGTLLFFGQPNVPEIEIEERTAHETKSLKIELSKDSVSVEKNVENFVERFSEKTRDEGEQRTVRSSLSESKPDEICREGSVDVTASSNKERSRGDESENSEILEGRRELDDEKIEKQTIEWNDERLSDGEVMENQYASIPKASDIESDYEKSEADSFDSERVNTDSLESSAWKQVEQQEDEEEDEEDDGLDSGSDGDDSSSPDASEADIMPMLDELHPLLDEDMAQPIRISHVGSNAPSEQSSRLSTSSIESVDETENLEDSEVADDEIDNEDGEEDDDDVQGDKENHAKVAITWTEEDQKNLMDLGCSEIERNQRLENLIMRRRTRQIMSMVPEINLIDLESSDFPNVAPINTNRQNPFDLPHDSYDNLGLPPIPGSAPSILLPRRNPFDIPYDSTEEKPDQMGDGFQEEVKTSQSRDPFFRRRDSFNVGPSVFAPSRQDLKWKPYFMPERMVLEESSYSTLQRQSSEMSDSKVSSVSETESVSSVEDLENLKLEEEDDPQEVIEEGSLGGQDQVSRRGSSEEDEPEVISEMNHVGHGSQSSEGEECLELGSVKKREIEIMDRVKDNSEEGIVGNLNSSLSEVTERVSTLMDDQDLSMSDDRNICVSVEPDISRQTSNLNINSMLVDDVPHKELVYDSSLSDENFADQQTQGDKNIEELGEEKRPERGSPTPVEGRLEVENSIDKGKTVQSPNSDTDYHEANEKISTPSTGRSTSHFYDSAMHEPDFEHLQEVQVPNTPVESSEKVRSIHNIHIPGLHVLNRITSPSIKSSLTTDSVSEVDVSHVDTQTILEGAADEIKENHAGKLSQLASAESSTSTKDPEVKSFEENKVQEETRLENTRNGTVNDVREAHSDIERGNSSESSSSSDSEENKKAMWAKRRLSTPF